MTKVNLTKGSENIFADLGFDSVEAASLKLRAELMSALIEWAEAKGKKQRELADLWGVSQGRVSHLMNGKLYQFSLDMLVTFAAKSGMKTDLIIDAA